MGYISDEVPADILQPFQFADVMKNRDGAGAISGNKRSRLDLKGPSLVAGYMEVPLGGLGGSDHLFQGLQE